MEYLDRTKDIRKCSHLFISYKTYNKVTTCTLARWLKTVLSSSGIDSNMYTAHSFRGTAASVAFSSVVSMKDIMDTANWTSTKAFFLFYHKDLPVNNNDFATNVLDY